MKIIVLVDCQNDFITGPLGSKEARAAVGNIVKMLHDYNHEETLVLFTKDTHYDNYLETAEGKALPIPHCIEGTSGWSIFKSVSQEVDYSNKFLGYSSMSIRKSRILKNTFGSTDLANLLAEIANENFVEEIIYVGFCTDICVVSNVLMTKAACPETKLTVISSCCAGTTPEAHEAALMVMRSCQINVMEELKND